MSFMHNQLCRRYFVGPRDLGGSCGPQLAANINHVPTTLAHPVARPVTRPICQDRLSNWVSNLEAAQYHRPEIDNPFEKFDLDISEQSIDSPQSPLAEFKQDYLNMTSPSPQEAATTGRQHLRSISAVTMPQEVSTTAPQHSRNNSAAAMISVLNNGVAGEGSAPSSEQQRTIPHLPGRLPDGGSSRAFHRKNHSTASPVPGGRRLRFGTGQLSPGARGRAPNKYDLEDSDDDYDIPVQIPARNPARVPGQVQGARGHKQRDSRVTTCTQFVNHHGAAGRPGSAMSGSTVVTPVPDPTIKVPPMPAPAVPNSVMQRSHRPAPLDFSRLIGPQLKEVNVHKPNTTYTRHPVQPQKAEGRIVNEDGMSSHYSFSEEEDLLNNSTLKVSPLRVRKVSEDVNNANILKGYMDFQGKTGPRSPPPNTSLPTLPDGSAGAPLRSASIGTPLRSTSVVERKRSEHVPEMVEKTPSGIERSRSLHVPKSATMNDLQGHIQVDTPLWTPLTPYLNDHMNDHTRKASKTLFGEHGWLQDTAGGDKKPQLQKPAGFLGSIKKVARELVEKADLKHGKLRVRDVQEVHVSLDAREQSLLYCELEFILSNALDAYIKTQLNGGRLDPTKHKKICDTWAQKGRPKVLGFRYDLETQIDLCALHIGQFRFYGSRQVNESAITGLLYAMKMNSRAMRIRTLCQPDPVIAKHIVDSQALLVLIRSADSLQHALAEVSQFFKVVVDREKTRQEQKENRESFAKRITPDQGDCQWQDPKDVSGQDLQGGVKLVPENYDPAKEGRWAYQN